MNSGNPKLLQNHFGNENILNINIWNSHKACQCCLPRIPSCRIVHGLYFAPDNVLSIRCILFVTNLFHQYLEQMELFRFLSASPSSFGWLVKFNLQHKTFAGFIQYLTKFLPFLVHDPAKTAKYISIRPAPAYTQSRPVEVGRTIFGSSTGQLVRLYLVQMHGKSKSWSCRQNIARYIYNYAQSRCKLT